MPDDKDKRIGELEDDLQQRDRRIAELKQEVDETRTLLEEMREHVQDSGDMTERFVEAFDMVLTDDGHWRWPTVEGQLYDLTEKHNSLVSQWNRMVPKYNALVAPRGIGRPLAASEAQQRQVHVLRKAGKSLRAIVGATGLGLATVRTITGKADGTDRTTKKTNELRRLELNRAKMATYRSRKRTRDALPKQITEQLKRGKELLKRAGVSAKR